MMIVDIARPWKNRVTKEHLEKETWKRKVDSWFQVAYSWRKMEAAAQDRAGCHSLDSS